MCSSLSFLFCLFVVSFAGDYVEPWTLRSSNGVLAVTLVADETSFVFNGITIAASCWNNSFIGPVLRLSPGDTLRFTLVNRLANHTNIHFHGLHVSPLIDNALKNILPNTQWTYDIPIPTDHPVGTFWYHSHAHGLSEIQTFNGMSGSIILEGILEKYYPDFVGIEQFVFQLKDLQYFNATPVNFIPRTINSNSRTFRSINGVFLPTFKIRPNEVQMWSILNIGADIFYRFNVSGLTFYEIQRDARPAPQVSPITSFELGPGTRVVILVVGPDEGNFTIQTDFIDNIQPFGDTYPTVQLGFLESVNNGTLLEPKVIPTRGGPTVPDLRQLTNKPVKNWMYNQTTTLPVEYFVNGLFYNSSRVDATYEVGDIVTWQIFNDSPEIHWFHIHQLDFQVTKIGGVDQPFVGYQDTVVMPNHTTVEIILPFTNPYLVGKFLFHCHIMQHEDTGMMSLVEIVLPGTPPAGSGSHTGACLFMICSFFLLTL